MLSTIDLQTRMDMKPATLPEAGVALERGPTLAAEQKIRQIVNEAAKLFDKVGYHTANMDMVAKACDLRKPTLYHYIKSKEEILLRIHQTLIDDLGAKHQARTELGLGREELLLGMITDILHAIADHRGYVRAFLEHYRELEPTVRQQISEKRQDYFRCITDLIAEGVAEGVYHTDDVTLSGLFLVGQVNWAYQWYVAGVSPAPEQIARKLLDTFLYGLTGTPPAAAKAARAKAPVAAKAKAKTAAASPARKTAAKK
jgi:AcrR family transcriptional regulator